MANPYTPLSQVDFEDQLKAFGAELGEFVNRLPVLKETLSAARYISLLDTSLEKVANIMQENTRRTNYFTDQPELRSLSGEVAIAWVEELLCAQLRPAWDALRPPPQARADGANNLKIAPSHNDAAVADPLPPAGFGTNPAVIQDESDESVEVARDGAETSQTRNSFSCESVADEGKDYHSESVDEPTPASVSTASELSSSSLGSYQRHTSRPTTYTAGSLPRSALKEVACGRRTKELGKRKRWQSPGRINLRRHLPLAKAQQARHSAITDTGTATAASAASQGILPTDTQDSKRTQR